jgi:hypothetical protein
VDRIMGHLLVNSGIRCQVILVKRGAVAVVELARC